MSDGRLNAMLDPDAVELATELDGLPLALATAGAYLDQTAIGFSDYLRLYKASWAKLLETSPELSSYEDRTLYSTWQKLAYSIDITFERRIFQRIHSSWVRCSLLAVHPL